MMEKTVNEKDGTHVAPTDLEVQREISLDIAQGKILEHSHDADEAMKAFADNHGVSLEIDEATNKRLLRKIDWHLLPVMCLVYGLNYLDKTTISYASIMGFKKDIGLVGNDYSWVSSMFYFGYLAFEYPTNRLLQRLPIGKFSACAIIAWGAVLCCMAAVSNYGGALAVRFFLGLCESAVTPGFALITSQWYTKAEQGTRVGIWFCFNGWAQILGGLVAYAIARGVDKHGSSVEAWKINFIWTGLLTVCVGIVFFFIVPDNQLNARWLSKEDQILCLERIRKNQQGVGNKHFKMYQLKEALTDPLSWMFFFYALVADIPNGGISNFFSQLIVSFGYTSEQSLLYGTPGGAVEVVSIIAWACYTQYYPNQRIWFAGAWLCVALVGIILIVALPLDVKAGRLAGYYLTQASPVPFVCLLSLIATNVAGYTKKTTVAAMYLIGYCIGNIIGPQTFTAKSAPRYVSAEVTIIVCWGLCLIDLACIYLYCVRKNKQKIAITSHHEYQKLENQEFLDLTDKENPEFLYTT